VRGQIICVRFCKTRSNGVIINDRTGMSKTLPQPTVPSPPVGEAGAHHR